MHAVFAFAAEVMRDEDYIARLGKLGPIVYIPKVVSYYRRGHTSLTNKNVTALHSKLTLLATYLESIEPSHGKLKKRLQKRVLLTLKK